MEDLNSEWDDDISDTINLPLEPEVVSVKEWAKTWMAAGNKIDLFFDIHSNSQKYARNNLWSQNENLELLVDRIYQDWKLIYIIENPGVYLAPKDYLNYGKGIVAGVHDFLRLKK